MKKAEPGARVALLRHRFASQEQFRAHLVAMEGSTLLFFRDPNPALAIGAEALLEIAFDNSEDTRVVRASAFARTEGQGIWLAMPSARLAREIREGDLVARRGRRLGADRSLRLRRESGTEHLVMLADLSLGGARLSGGLPAGLAKQDKIELQLSSPQSGEPVDSMSARVVWCEEGEAGIEIDRSKPSVRAAVTMLFRSLEARWLTAREVRHLDLCCRDGKLLDPPAPRLRGDGKRDPASR